MRLFLYIGTKDSGFTEYPMTYEETLTPEILIAGIADLTGWDMTLAEDVTTGKGGMSVCFADSSALFTGPPDPQNEEFFMFSADQLAQTILDSTQKTLQMGFTGEGGDPDALDIYYYMEGEKPLELGFTGQGGAPDALDIYYIHGGRKAAGTAGHWQGMAAGSALCVVKLD